MHYLIQGYHKTLAGNRICSLSGGIDYLLYMDANQSFGECLFIIIVLGM